MSNSQIPFDVVRDILCRLPAESLLRFRSISKSCCSLVEIPDFIKHHLNQSVKTGTNHSLIVEYIKPNGLIKSIDLDSPGKCLKLTRPFPVSYKVLIQSLFSDLHLKFCSDIFGSCNGLLAFYAPPGNIILLNPSTNKYLTLPKFGSENDSSHGGHNYTNGFGYDAVSDDYKVVRITPRLLHERSRRVMVYSLRTNSWTRVEDFPYSPNEYYVSSRFGVHAGSSLHWVVHRYASDNILIVAFDLRKDKFSLIQLETFRRFKLSPIRAE
ncbi:hypothetical protein Tsubulata_014372 [Turnera subulata]|uniref:F-box domain-containing protein n=1 Tax=Turnera subulata TaxID=218843 RepID=A0A9Q0JIR3_9ROSI|nr:hypothetical protein Tsubulata_014372 [Turnera subulata]